MGISFAVFISGEHIDLVVLTEEIVEKTNWYNWFNDEETTSQMQQHYFPNTRQKQLQIFKTRIENSETKLQLGIVDKKERVLIGMVSLSDIDYLHRKCEIAGIIGEKRYRRLAYIVEALQLLIRHAFEQLNMHKIYGGTISKEVADMCVRTLGFKHEGIRKAEVFKNGEYRDIYLVGLTRADCESQ